MKQGQSQEGDPKEHAPAHAAATRAARLIRQDDGTAWLGAVSAYP